MPPLRFLLVDDAAVDRALWRRTLQVAWPEAQVVEAASVGEAREALHAGAFDVVISDHVMPGGSGVDLLEVVRAERPEALRLLVTGAGAVETAMDAVNRAKVHGLLAKADGPARVRELVEALLRERRS